MTSEDSVQCLTYRLLAPDVVLDLAYAFHVSNDGLLKSGETGRIANRAVADFRRLGENLDSRSEEFAFMFKLNLIIVSLSRGISRGKEIYAQQLQAAYEEKEKRIREMSDATIKRGWARGSIKAILVGGIGYSLTKAFFPSLNLSITADPNYVSLATGIALTLISTWVQGILINNKVIQIFANYDFTKLHAHRRYRSELKVEYLRAKAGARQAWIEYTGLEPLNLPGFETVMEEEDRLETLFQQGRYEITAGPFSKLFRELGPWRMLKSVLSGRKDS